MNLEYIELFFKLLVSIILIIYLWRNFMSGFASGFDGASYVLSNSDNTSDYIAPLNTKIFLGKQSPTNQKQWKYNIIKAPLNKSILITAQYKNRDKVNIKETIIRIVRNKNNTLDLLGNNKALIQILGYNIDYYITFLSDSNAEQYKQMLENRQRTKGNYEKCIRDLKNTGIDIITSKKSCVSILDELSGNNIQYITN